MEIQKLKISNLKPAPYNPRKDLQPEDPQYKKIRRSIQEFGCVEPIIYNKRTGHVVGGHQRIKVLEDLGEKEIEAVIVDIPEKEEKKLVVLLNRARGRWDDEKLAELMKELDELGEVELTGFDEWELQGILDSYDQIDDILDYSPAPAEEPEEEEKAMFTMTFTLPSEYGAMAQEYMDSNEYAEEIITSAIMQRIREGD